MVNKADNNQREDDRWEFLALGLGDPYPISALHGRRTGDFLDEVVARLPSADGHPADGDDAADDDGDGAEGAAASPARRSRPWPSWAGPTWARARCSTG